MSTKAIRSIVGASSGNLVEWFDFYVYSFTSIYFASSFFPKSDPTAQLLSTAAIFAVGFFIRPVGGVIYGKVSYMSPEQARGEPLDGRSDVYAAGIILWELLTGRQLFPPGKQQPQDLLDRAKNPQIDPPSKRAPRVPPELDAIVLRGLTSDRDKRYQTGEEMRAALAGWLAKAAPECDAARLETQLRVAQPNGPGRDATEGTHSTAGLTATIGLQPLRFAPEIDPRQHCSLGGTLPVLARGIER